MPAKAAAKRMSSLVLGVFMLQVIAAGFCVTTASAMPAQQVSSMEHCMTGSMQMSKQMDAQMQGMDMSSQDMASHACSHCDMPDATVSFDKHTLDALDLVADMIVVALLVPTASQVASVSYLDAPPDVGSALNQLTTFNLNLRIRV